MTITLGHIINMSISLHVLGLQCITQLERCPADYMNLQYLFPFLHYSLSVSINNILQKFCFFILQSVKTITHISAWLSGNVEDLAELDFEVANMGDILDKLLGIVSL